MASFMKKTDGTISTLPFDQTYSNLLSPTSQRLAVRPFSPERETFEPLPLSIQIHSLRLRFSLDTYTFVKKGKLLRYLPLWRERVKVTNFVCCRQIPMGFGTV